MVVVLGVRSTDISLVFNLVVSVLSMVLSVKWVGVCLVFILAVSVKPKSPFAEIVVQSSREHSGY